MYQGKEHAARAALLIRSGQAPQGQRLIIWLLARLAESEFTADDPQEGLAELLMSDGPATMLEFGDGQDRGGDATKPLPGPVAKEEV